MEKTVYFHKNNYCEKVKNYFLNIENYNKLNNIEDNKNNKKDDSIYFMIDNFSFEVYYKENKLLKSFFNYNNFKFDRTKIYNVTIFNDHNIINILRNKKIIEFIKNIKINKLTIFNYTKFKQHINKLNTIINLELYGNCHNITPIKCNIYNNLPVNLKKLAINCPLLDYTFIHNLPNKIQKLNLNFFINYIPNSVKELVQQNMDKVSNKKHKNKYLITTNKLIRLELFNSKNNNKIILDKLPSKLYYFTIKIENYSIKKTSFYNIYNNFACKKSLLKKYNTNLLNSMNYYDYIIF